MEYVKKAIVVSGTPWEPCSANELKIKRSSLNHEAIVWFNFVKQSLLPTSHTTNVEKERMMSLDVILGEKDVDVGRLICREIMVCNGKKVGYLFFPCLITTLCINAGVEITGEKKSFPMDGFSTVLKLKKPATASADISVLQQFMLQQRAVWEFQRKQHMWLASVLSVNFNKEPASMNIPTFPDWVVDEEAMDDVLFEDQLSADEEDEEVVIEKKRKRGNAREVRKETRGEVKRGKKPLGAEEENEQEEDEDLLAISSDSESLSEGEKKENIDVMKESRKESEQADPTSSNDEGEDFHDGNDDLNPDSDSIPHTTEPVKETTPENHPSQENLSVEPFVNADIVAATTDAVDAAVVEGVFSPTRKMRTKHVEKRRKMAKIVEEHELDVEGVTAVEDASLKVTVDAVM